jgi:hypothetical protein
VDSATIASQNVFCFYKFSLHEKKFADLFLNSPSANNTTAAAYYSSQKSILACFSLFPPALPPWQTYFCTA